MTLEEIERNRDVYRARMDECWIELESAKTWEEINQINVRLAECGRLYKTYKRMALDLTGDGIHGMVSPWK